MSEWVFAQSNPTQQLARLHYFSTKKLQDGQEIEFVITVREYTRSRPEHEVPCKHRQADESESFGIHAIRLG